MLELTGSRSELHVPYDKVYGTRIDDMLHREPAIEKIGAAIGWAPTRTLDDILDDVIAFERENVAQLERPGALPRRVRDPPR